jgi:hypothetical protein
LVVAQVTRWLRRLLLLAAGIEPERLPDRLLVNSRFLWFLDNFAELVVELG